MSKPPAMLQYTKQPYIADVGSRRIESIHFSTLSGSEVLKTAVVEVYKGSYYDANKKPVTNGLLDLRMGPPNKRSVCATCHGNFQECPGHYGYLALALPVYNVGYLSNIVDILKCICKNCSRVLLEEKERQAFLRKMRNPRLEPLRKTDLFKKIVKRCNSKAGSNKLAKCPRCGHINGMVKKAPYKVVYDRGRVIDSQMEECQSAVSSMKACRGNITSTLDPLFVFRLLRNMLDEDCELLYIHDRPEKLIVTNILVPPTAIRPSVFVDGGTQSNENDITERLKYIIEANASLSQQLLETNIYKKGVTSWETLQIEVAQYINSDTRGLPLYGGGSSKPLSGFVQRLKGKQGRFRGNLSGKRVEYTGRTVISPDPNLKITEVAVPILMAKILTYPERVSHHNIAELRECVRRGPNEYPGAKFIRQPDGTEISLRFSSRKIHADALKYGDIVDRHLKDGDIVLFNRQPSLHRMSIMCHRARIMPWRTLRFNESVCNPYNADFDGDEMNMHVPQTEESRAEAIMLMGVQNNLCTPKNGEVLVASTQDFLTSSFLITRKDTFYDRSAFSLICAFVSDGLSNVDLPMPAVVKPVELWTGKQLFSVLLRPHKDRKVFVNLTVEEKIYKSGETMCPRDGFVCIRNSELISGQLGKATLGNGSKDGLYSILLRDYGSHAAADCMNQLAKLSSRWIGNHGFSIGINDVQPGDILNTKKKTVIDDEYGQCIRYIESCKSGMLELLPGCNKAETLEAKTTKTLNKIRDTMADVCMQNLHWRNSPLIMSQCGSKGSPMNICQMILCVGQQSVGGRRVPNGFLDRTLPHFERGANDPDAKGFVQNSFYTGLLPTEFFFHTMGGREGLVDTAVKTADTGYMSRRLIKALEDLSVQYDCTVRNSSGCIVQFTYGDDGLDPAQMEEKTGFPLNFERLFMKAKATCPAEGRPSLKAEDMDCIINKVMEENCTRSDISEMEKCSETFVASLLSFLNKRVYPRSMLSEKLNSENISLQDKIYLQSVVSSTSGITLQQLEVFLNMCFARYRPKKIESGTAVGAIGAQSIGEPGTQMTLKTFHFAGVASMNVTLGVPRIREIIDAAKRIKTPIITTELQRKDCFITAIIVKGLIEKTLLEQIAEIIGTSRSPRMASIVISLDRRSIEDARLCIDAYNVKESILLTPKMKLKEQQIRVLNPWELEVTLEADRSKLLFELHGLKLKLSKVVVKGVKQVERVIRNETKGEDRSQGKKFNLIVEGTGFLSVLGIQGVDAKKTKSNHIMEVFQVLGIEAARIQIINEIQYTMLGHKMTIDIRHMMLLADLMTFKGEVLGITRYGVRKMRDSVLMLASFERTADHLFNAPVNGRIDRIEGVSECIMLGIPMRTGTGMMKVKNQSSAKLSELDYKPYPMPNSW